MRKKFLTASYKAPALTRLSLCLERGFVASTIDGEAGNEDFGYKDETWD